jgi:DHA1 family inner membrane transport protein
MRLGRLGAIVIVVAFLVLLFIPSTTTEATAKASLSRQIRVLAQRDVILSYAVMTLGSIGFFALFTYVTPLLTTLTGIAADVVPALLLAFGIGSTLGALAGGKLADWRPLQAVIGLMAAEMVVFTIVLFFAGSAIAMAVAVIVLGFCAFSYAPSLFVRLFKAAGDAADLASALISTAFNIGIAAGAAIGGAMLSAGAGYNHLGIVGFVTAALAICAVLTMQARARREELDALVALTA